MYPIIHKHPTLYAPKLQYSHVALTDTKIGTNLIHSLNPPPPKRRAHLKRAFHKRSLTARPSHYRVTALFNDPHIPSLIPIPRRVFKFHLHPRHLRLPRLEKHFLEPLEFLRRPPDAWVLLRDIHLYDFRPCHGAGVSYCHGYGNERFFRLCCGRGPAGRGNFEIGQLERGIGEPVPKGKQDWFV